MNSLGQGFQKLDHYKQTDRHYAIEEITTPHSRVAMNILYLFYGHRHFYIYPANRLFHYSD